MVKIDAVFIKKKKNKILYFFLFDEQHFKLKIQQDFIVNFL